VKSFLLAYLLLFYSTVAAQRTIKGEVTDVTGKGIMGATVHIKNTTNSISTDFNGRYTIEVDDGAVLLFSSAGYARKEILITRKNTLHITLQIDLDIHVIIICDHLGRYIAAHFLQRLNYGTIGLNLETNKLIA